MTAGVAGRLASRTGNWPWWRPDARKFCVSQRETVISLVADIIVSVSRPVTWAIHKIVAIVTFIVERGSRIASSSTRCGG
ncbi:hypothetical protein [Streptomyces niveus]|uniref:hypothetical protein n=1 Tax=Streptomyces niveus TaxID=193462 RepID=UPI00133197E8|nr:hypothetical protein [Streptomyces niveus]